MVRRVLAAALAAGVLAGWALPVAAAEPKMPGQPVLKYERWWYPAQVPNGPIEDGALPALPGAGGGFLTLPFAEPHFVTSIFDHCGPNYVPDGVVCRFDGLRKQAGGFDEDGPPTQAWLFYDGHDGLDYGLYYEDVLASADGTVVYAGWDRPGCATCGFGQEIRIDHGNGITTRYAHLSRLRVARGQHVRRGQVIATSGNSGASTGEHLHWGVYRTEGFVPIDPYGWTGAGADPWPHDVGDLWLEGAPRFPAVSLPAVSVGVSVKPDVDGSLGREFVVDWKGGAIGVSYDVAVVEDGRAARAWLSGVGAGSATYAGVQPGHTYWFLVTESNDLGWHTTGASDVVGTGVGGLDA